MPKYNIIGAGLTGAVLASQLKGSTVYEKNGIGGLCRDNDKYQEFVHIFHTSDESIWEYINSHTQARPFKHYVKSFVNGGLKHWMPSIITPKVVSEQMVNYGLKMWRSEPPEAALLRVEPKMGSLFDDKYQAILNFRQLFESMLKDSKVVHRQIKNGDLENDTIILTGAIDEYFDYCYGKLPYRGMKSCHCQSEEGLEVPVITFPNDFPFVRMVDYQRLGYQNYIGFEFPSDDPFYPVNTPESKIMYDKYKQLADDSGIILAGRLATYTYMEMGQCVDAALKLARRLNG